MWTPYSLELKLSDIGQHDTEHYSNHLAPIMANLQILSEALRGENIILTSEDKIYIQQNLNKTINFMKKKKTLAHSITEEDA